MRWCVRVKGGARVEKDHLILSPSCSLLSRQVYRARVRATGQEVAVKVQRPAALSTISKVGIKTKALFGEVDGGC